LKIHQPIEAALENLRVVQAKKKQVDNHHLPEAAVKECTIINHFKALNCETIQFHEFSKAALTKSLIIFHF
jgi:hypothetical protein